MFKLEKIKFYGRVVPGVGEGSRYVEIYRNIIEEILNIKPYPGTLNIDAGRDLSPIFLRLCAYRIPPPKPQYKPVLAYPGFVEGIPGYIIKPQATVHSWNIVEFITTINMRKELGLKDGDIVEVVVYRLVYPKN